MGCRILIFAFSMRVIIYGLHNAGLTAVLVKACAPIVAQGLLQASLIMGGLVSILSNVFNNHPALMIGTITLTELNLDPVTLKIILLPIGTLASLLWMHNLRQRYIPIRLL